MVKTLPAVQETWVQSPAWEDPRDPKRERLSTSVFLPGEFHRQRSMVGYSPWGCKELDMTEQLTHTMMPKMLLKFWPQVSAVLDKYK